MVKEYILNRAGAPVDGFPWLQEFESWVQRTGTTRKWTYAENPPNTSARWAATVTFGEHNITGYGPDQREARRDAVINIERAGILYI